MTVEEFDDKMRAGRMGHVGLPESMGMLFDTVGKKLARYEAGVEPLVADRPIATDDFQVKRGQVRGLEQVARGYDDDDEFVKLTFVAGLEESNDVDTIQISGRPDLNVELRGTNGDLATVAMAVNAIRRVHEAAPGLYTMRDLPVVTVW
jgi:4-hydroxy-tetrahydrodipicolinate reductase